MLFVVHFEDIYADHPERLPERTLHMPEHLAFLVGRGDLVVAAGALRPTEDGVPAGGIWIVNAESKQAVEALYQDDPFWKAGLRKSVHVSYWSKAYWSPGFAGCMEAFGA